jgi:methionyl-tRNA formyltransferase
MVSRGEPEIMIELGPIHRILLMGGGKILYELAKWGSENGLEIDIITSERHAIEEIDPYGRSFQELCPEICSRFLISTDIKSEESQEFIGTMENTFALSISAAWIFKENFIKDIFEDKLFNLHSTPLPKNRGGGGFSWQILQKDPVGGCVIHKIDGGVDTGGIIASIEHLFPSNCRTPKDYFAYQNELILTFLKEFFEKIKDKIFLFKVLEQSDDLSTHWPRLNTSKQAWIDWSGNVDFIDRFVCAFDDPYPGAQTLLGKKKIILKKTLTSYSEGLFHPFQYGLVYRNNKKWINVATNGGTLIVQEVFDENNSNILSQIKVGDRFHSPVNFIENKNERVFYNSKGLR